MTSVHPRQGSQKRFVATMDFKTRVLCSPHLQVLVKGDPCWVRFFSREHPDTRVHGKLAMMALPSHPSRTIGRSRDSAQTKEFTQRGANDSTRPLSLVLEIMPTLVHCMGDESETQTQEKIFCLARFSHFFLTGNIFKFQQHSYGNTMTSVHQRQGSQKRFWPSFDSEQAKFISPTLEVLVKGDPRWVRFCSREHPGTRVHGKLAMMALPSHPSRTIGRSRDSAQTKDFTQRGANDSTRPLFLVLEIMSTLAACTSGQSETQTQEKIFCLARVSHFFLTRNMFKFQQHSCGDTMTTVHPRQGSQKRFVATMDFKTRVLCSPHLRFSTRETRAGHAFARVTITEFVCMENLQ